jgi:hypothetical protein
MMLGLNPHRTQDSQAMKRISLKEMSVEHLVERFVALAVAESEAIDRGDNSMYNRLFPQMEDVREELKDRPGDQRRALVPLLDHPNPQVRLIAAVTTLEVAPEVARRALELIKDRDEFPQAADAYGVLRRLDGVSLFPD